MDSRQLLRPWNYIAWILRPPLKLWWIVALTLFRLVVHWGLILMIAAFLIWAIIVVLKYRTAITETVRYLYDLAK